MIRKKERIKDKCKYYEFNDNVTYKRKNIDFNEYGFNNYSYEDEILKYSAKTGPNCVNNKIKRQ